jgi:hypothetical protein
MHCAGCGQNRRMCPRARFGSEVLPGSQHRRHVPTGSQAPGGAGRADAASPRACAVRRHGHPTHNRRTVACRQLEAGWPWASATIAKPTTVPRPVADLSIQVGRALYSITNPAIQTGRSDGARRWRGVVQTRESRGLRTQILSRTLARHRFPTFRAPRHKTFPPLMSLSGQSASQEMKCAALGQVDMSRPTSLNNGNAFSSKPGI